MADDGAEEEVLFDDFPDAGATTIQSHEGKEGERLQIEMSEEPETETFGDDIVTEEDFVDHFHHGFSQNDEITARKPAKTATNTPIMSNDVGLFENQNPKSTKIAAPASQEMRRQERLSTGLPNPISTERATPESRKTTSNQLSTPQDTTLITAKDLASLSKEELIPRYKAHLKSGDSAVATPPKAINEQSASAVG